MIDLSQFKRWTVEEFERVFPPSSSPARPNGGSAGAQGAANGVGTGVGEIDEADLTDDLLEWVRDGVPAGEDRSVAFFRVVKALKKFSYSAEAIFELFSRHPAGIAQKYVDQGSSGSRARLQREVERAYNRPPRAPRPAKAPPPVPSVAVAAGVSPSTVSPPPSAQLEKAVAIYRKWFALKNDWPVYVVYGVIAANLLEGDPVWLGLIGPSSSIKTELLDSLTRLSNTHVVDTFSPAGLLSGTPRKSRVQGATGGVLKSLGAFGVLLFRDFGSLLELRHEQRAAMMSALRNIHDRYYVRDLGGDGGVKLEWRGKAGCIFGATEKYDTYHAVIGTLGDRFVLFRVGVLPREQLQKCRARRSAGGARVMREEVAQATIDLFASLPDPLPEPASMVDVEYARMERAVLLAIRLRAGIVRDNYKREIDDVHSAEGPARLYLVLEQLFAGLVLIGVSRVEACEVIDQVVFDSTPKLRLKAFRALTADWQSTSEIEAKTKVTNTPTRRALEDLAAQGLAARKEASKQVSRGSGRVSLIDMEHWKLTSDAIALSHPKST